MAAMGLIATVAVVAVVVVLMVVGTNPASAQDDDVIICQSDADCQGMANTKCFDTSQNEAITTTASTITTTTNTTNTITTNNNTYMYCRCIPSHNNQSGSCLPNQIGDACGSDVDCSDVIENTHCPIRIRKCRCKMGYLKNKDGKCKTIEIGDSCKTNQQCQTMIDNSSCFKPRLNQKKVCACKDGYYLPGIASSSSSSSTTTSSSNRSSGNSTIRTQDDRKQMCVRKLANTACDDHHHCTSSDNAECDYLDGFCKCKPPFSLKEDGSECYFRYLGDSCAADEECDAPDSVCLNGVCSCQNELVANGNKTICVFIDHKNCTTDVTCSKHVIHSVCNPDRNVCSCQTGYQVNADFNHCQEIKLGDACSSDADCLAKNRFSECSGDPSVCQCRRGHVLEMYTDKFFCRRRHIGRHACLTQADCTHAVNDSACVQCADMKETHRFCNKECAGPDVKSCNVSTCLCQVGFYSHKGGTECKKRRIQDRCDVDEDCRVSVPNSVCLPRGICHCQSGYLPVGRDVCKKRIIDDKCQTDKDCLDVIASSFCHKDQQSIADKGNADDDDDNDDDGGVVAAAAGGDDNNAAAAAGGGGGVGVDGRCSCLSGYHSEDGQRCQKRRLGDQTCSLDSDCSDAVAGSLCVHGMCVCRHGYFPGFDLTSCTPRTLHGPYCSVDRHCDTVIPYSRCLEHRCVCSVGFRAQTERECVEFKLDDPGCREDDDCAWAVENSKCNTGSGSASAVSVCACVTGYHPDIISNETCVPRNISGHSCQRDEDCSHSVANSYCKDEVCACVSGYFDEANGTLCVKRVLGDVCSMASDCADVINNSTCTHGVCTCELEFDSHENGTGCFLKPVEIGLPCIFGGQCQEIDNASICAIRNDDDVIKTCVCSDDMFVGASLKECVQLPTKTQERCRWDTHCRRAMDNSHCDNNTKVCACDDGYFQDEGGRQCTPLPTQFGHRCLEHAHCTQLEEQSVCHGDNNTCVCRYGYTQQSSTQCVERSTIPAYSSQPTTRPPVECEGSCLDRNNSICDTKQGVSRCRCDYRYAAAPNNGDCVAVQTYLYKLRLTREAGIYDYHPLVYHNKTSALLTNRIIHGISQTLMMTRLKTRHVSSEVLNIQPLVTEPTSQPTIGVQANVLIQMRATYKYYKATLSTHMDAVIRKQLRMSNRELGESKLMVGLPLKRSSVLTDFDECGSNDHSDCSPQALCVNTMGSFMCVCRSDHIDVSSTKGKRSGRECAVPQATVSDSSKCSTAHCKTSWEFVGLVLTLVFLIVMAFIVYEIIQRKQNFNARKLYERFGTTRIRRLKLTTAGLKRLQERKRYRKKYKKRMKKEMKRNKRKRWFGGKIGLGSGTDDSDGEKSPPPTPHVMDTEELPPSPSEFVHTPTVPMTEDSDACTTQHQGRESDVQACRVPIDNDSPFPAISRSDDPATSASATASAGDPEVGKGHGTNNTSPVTLHPTSSASFPDNSVTVFIDD